MEEDARFTTGLCILATCWMGALLSLCQGPQYGADAVFLLSDVVAAFAFWSVIDHLPDAFFFPACVQLALSGAEFILVLEVLLSLALNSRAVQNLVGKWLHGILALGILALFGSIHCVATRWQQGRLPLLALAETCLWLFTIARVSSSSPHGRYGHALPVGLLATTSSNFVGLSRPPAFTSIPLNFCVIVLGMLASVGLYIEQQPSLRSQQHATGGKESLPRVFVL
jgi:hypothetical protein